MSLFFRPKHKAQKDRAVLKIIDQTLSKQGLPSALLHFIFLLLIEWQLLAFQPTPKTAYFFGLALVVMAAWRFVMIAQFESWYSKGPARWRDVFIFSGFMHAAIWSGYLFFRLYTGDDHPILWLGILYTATIAAGATFVYSPYGNTVRVYFAILLVPLALYFLAFSDSLVDRIIGIGVVGMYFYLVGTASRVASLLWGFSITNHEFRQRLAELEQAKRETSVESSFNRQFIQQLLARLKSPLSGLLGVLGMLATEVKDSDNQGMLNIARRSGYSILDLMTDLEAFIEQRDQSYVPQTVVFNLRKTLEHALADMGSKAHENGRELAYLYHPDVPERIDSDPQLLSNAFRRLLDFAIDMADSGEIAVRISTDLKETQEYLNLAFYFHNSEIQVQDLATVLTRKPNFLPEDEDISDQLTLMVAAGQFKALSADLSASNKGELLKISVTMPIQSTSQQASSFQPSKFMQGKSIMLVDLSPLNERSLAAEFVSWGMAVTSWKMDRLESDDINLDMDFLLINIPVQDQFARVQLDRVNRCVEKFHSHTSVLLYASQLQHSLISKMSPNHIFVEKPVARDNLLWTLRSADDQSHDESSEKMRCAGKKLLVAEDNLLNQKVLLSLLTQAGIDADTCTNGKEAVEYFEQKQYDLILMDCFMPRVDGMQATKNIRKLESESGKHVPIIAMTSEQKAELEREFLAAGVDDFLEKPVNFDALVDVIQRWTS